MNVCANCGFEFDGDLCPECGTKYESSSLPYTDSSEVTLSAPQIYEPEFLPSEHTYTNCGTTFQGNCCPKCGLRITDSMGENVEISSAVEKKYWVLTRLPLILFFSLVFLLLIAYFCNLEGYNKCIVDKPQ